GEFQVYELDSAETARAVAAADPLAAGGALAGSELKPWEGVMAGGGPGAPPRETHYRSAGVDGIEVFYREAGPKDAPVLLLLHGCPTSSRMFRDLIPRLSDA